MPILITTSSGSSSSLSSNKEIQACAHKQMAASRAMCCRSTAACLQPVYWCHYRETNEHVSCSIPHVELQHVPVAKKSLQLKLVCRLLISFKCVFRQTADFGRGNQYKQKDFAFKGPAWCIYFHAALPVVPGAIDTEV